jgi:hypothetical protein
MKIVVFGASGPLGRRSTGAARAQSLNLRPEPGPAAAMCRCTGLAHHPVLQRRIWLGATVLGHADAALGLLR